MKVGKRRWNLLLKKNYAIQKKLWQQKLKAQSVSGTLSIIRVMSLTRISSPDWAMVAMMKRYASSEALSLRCPMMER